MFYLHQGRVYVTEVGRQQSEWKDVEASGLDLDLCIRYMWWCYSDTSDFSGYPILDRLEEIRSRLGMEKKDYDKLREVCSACVEFYQQCQLTSAKRNRLTVRDKQAELRTMLMAEKSPRTMLEIQKSLKAFEDMEKEYDVEIEIAGGDVYAEACPVNLFSLPEYHKPVHLRAVLTV